MVKKEITGIGYCLDAYESNVLKLVDKDINEKYVSIASLFADCDAQAIDDSVERGLFAESKSKSNNYWVEYLEDWREYTGEKYPKLYKVKISIELEEVDSTVSEEFWKTSNYGKTI